jgi:hypothetical protein
LIRGETRPTTKAAIVRLVEGPPPRYCDVLALPV